MADISNSSTVYDQKSDTVKSSEPKKAKKSQKKLPYDGLTPHDYRKKKFTQRKRGALMLAQRYREAGDALKNFNNIKQNFNSKEIYLEHFLHNKQYNWENKALKTSTCHHKSMVARETGKIVQTISCSDRLCPLCAENRARKNAKLIVRVVDAIKKEVVSSKDYILVTLTLQNCYGCDLQDIIKLMLTAFHNMTSNKNTRWCQAFEGWFRSLEITYSIDKDTYHPHLHILCMVDHTYFSKQYNPDAYIKTEEMSEMFRQALINVLINNPNKPFVRRLTGAGKVKLDNGHWCLLGGALDSKIKLDYCICDMRRIYSNARTGKHSLASAIAEVAKYACKPSDVAQDWKVAVTMSVALRGVHTCAFGGLLKDIASELRISADEFDDFDNLEEVDEKGNKTKLNQNDIVDSIAKNKHKYVWWIWNWKKKCVMEIDIKDDSEVTTFFGKPLPSTSPPFT